MWQNEQKPLGTLFGLGLVVGLLSISACQKSEQVTAPDQSSLPEVPQVEALASTISGGTVAEDFALHPPREDGRRAPMLIWRCLQLDSAQQRAVLACLRSHREAVHTVLRTLRESERQYWEQAREMRRSVLDSLRQGALTRQEAAQRLQEIAQWLRTQLQNNPTRQWAAEELQRLKQTLCECVAQVLTPEQLPIWQCWCSGGTNCCPNEKDPRGPRGPRP
ncbi:MAG: hypothetical protein NZ473_03300 [Candidatus Kapabacteria bacterium]|nr:hypothetical protein [Candidatus Kapabacteria bacterium]MCS7169362.1 hypothetical protein [Candidatus Kapabacteria bacterium]MDW7997378.1 hypothetical protein [Bacteroidota bacterium]MDW8224464.1 hypothetical protein [Bacteroidota bacterium]